MRFMQSMEVKNKEEQLAIIKSSINRLISRPEESNCYDTFMKGYNAVYLYCTENTKESYIIEGAEVYKIYDQALTNHLKRLPEDYTLETFVRFVDAYIRANERVCKMLTFLSRYFVRVNVEISNTNVIELKKLYFERLYSMLIEGKEHIIHPLFIEGLGRYTDMKEKKQEKTGVYERHLKILRVMLRTYIKVCEISNQKKSLKKLLNSVAKFIASLKEKEQTAFIYYKMAAVDSLFKKKEKSKKTLYWMVEEKIDEHVLKSFIKEFVSKILRSGINKKTHAEIAPFYSFIDNSVKGKDIFINNMLLMSIKIIDKNEECNSFLRFFIFIGKHLSYMPRTSKRVKKVFEMVLTRRMQSILDAPDCKFENELLECINVFMKTKHPPIVELSLLISNVSAHKTIFWKMFIVGVKNRLILGNLASVEKKLINLTIRRIEQYKETRLRKEADVNKKVLEYIDADTLYKTHQYYDVFNFEELLLCIKDIATSEVYFKTEKPDQKSECLLLVYTRWSYPVVNMHIPPELEDTWNSVKEYCKMKGRKYILRFCPTVSSITLELGEKEIHCDMLQGSIIILLTRGGPHSFDELVHALIVEITDKTIELVKLKIKTLLDSEIVRENSEKYEINTECASGNIDIFAPEIEDTLNEAETLKYAYSKGAIEARIVKTLKNATGMDSEKLKEDVMSVFPIEEKEVDLCILVLQEKGLISIADNILYFVP
ncbi:hypothetical protein NEMIN01_0806 [Nematocida minor]|uniref:uncharacterized protein n=1 Tax=Nematocida minor TaxID=1912983 RepID=UPI0022210653|nr:uncharacterized protein NEMIN01_0806 [Nematocida minor]KAI5190021.1 hypothetical protein NEMIN01_0806 [Nematocida minor]